MLRLVSKVFPRLILSREPFIPIDVWALINVSKGVVKLVVLFGALEIVFFCDGRLCLFMALGCGSVGSITSAGGGCFDREDTFISLS